MFTRSSVPMTIADESTVTIDVNAAMCDYLGRRREELIGRPLERYIAPASQRASAAIAERLRRTGDAVGETDLVRSDGTVLHTEFAARATVIDGRRLFLAVMLAGEPTAVRSTPREGALTPRERAVVHLLTLGMTSREIARRLSISVETVRTHVRNAMAKTGARTRAQLVAAALAERHTSEADGGLPAARR